ncbi:hypothetical protein HF1_09900 [Mycoplasma haemofelis str. Langford 1]|uniref:Uncharacterized protein n=1 Tax=Mycoplasma haemofelis (strain Langford 1) TaxID=941640 RepID=E8ZIM7_MYCHL|nr:hypothetical protein [Mycoplasma haemofelis]CBY92998.1 hypothetical protein HF1_09900 [Mycoplasma haemofelis str. Langford 1]
MDPLKLALATAGAGLGAYGMYSYGAFSGSKAENVGTRLVDEKFELLTNSHTEHWKTSSDKYNSKKASGTEAIDETKLKTLCRDLLSKDKTSDSDYKKAKLYCVVPRNVQQRLLDIGIHALKTDGQDEAGDKSKWEKLATSYVIHGKGEDQIESLTLTTPDSSSNNWSSLREKCKIVLEKDHWDDSFDSYLKKAKKWCTEESLISLPK